MKRKIKLISVFLIVLSVFISCIPLSSSASNKPTIENYLAIANQILDKYHMKEEMDYHLYEIPVDKTLREYEMYLEKLVSQTAYCILQTSSFNPDSISNDILEQQENKNSSLRRGPVRKTYTRIKEFAGEYRISASFTLSMSATNPAYITDSSEKLSQNILGSANLFGAMSLPPVKTGKVFKQTSTYADIRAPYTEFTAYAYGNLITYYDGRPYEDIFIGINAVFGREEVAYARSNCAFK